MEKDDRDLAHQAASSTKTEVAYGIKLLHPYSCESLHWLCGQQDSLGRGHGLWSKRGFSVGLGSWCSAVQVKDRAWGFAWIPRPHQHRPAEEREEAGEHRYCVELSRARA